MPKEEMEFYDVKTKAKFKTVEYKVVEKNGRFFIVAKSPHGNYESWKIISKDKADKLKE